MQIFEDKINTLTSALSDNVPLSFSEISKAVSIFLLENIQKYPFVIAVTGISCSGKSTFSKTLKKNLLNNETTVSIISVDNYLSEIYKGKDSYRKSKVTYLKPIHYEWRQLKSDIDKLKYNNSISIPKYQRGKGWGSTEVIYSSNIIIIEGLFLDSIIATSYMNYGLIFVLESTENNIRLWRHLRDSHYQNSRDTDIEVNKTLTAYRSYKRDIIYTKRIVFKLDDSFNVISVGSNSLTYYLK